MQSFWDKFPKNTAKQLRFALAGILVFCSIVIPGAVWYKSTVRSMGQSSSAEIVSVLKIRVSILRQQVTNELAIISQNLYMNAGGSSTRKIRRDFGFDFVVMLDRERQFTDGYRTLSGSRAVVDLNAKAIKRLIPTDTGFFDNVTMSNPASGIYMVEGRPLLISIMRIINMPSASLSAKGAGYLFAGRWLDSRRLASNGEQMESGLEVYSLSQEEILPRDVKSAISSAQRNNGYTYELGDSRQGVIYALLSDVNEQAAIMVRIPWNIPWSSSSSLGFSLFYIVAVIAGCATWGILTVNDFKNRKRVRRFDGLASLSTDHIRTFVEAFPGYCFALKSSMEYVGVSRILSGVTGQEPSYFSGQMFGAIAGEGNRDVLVKTFVSLRDPSRWPRVANIEHSVKGLGEDFEFEGMAHYLLKQDILLVILTPRVDVVSTRRSA